MASQRGICPECGQEYSLTEDGRLVAHGGRQSEVCPGSGALMRNIVLDDLVEGGRGIPDHIAEAIAAAEQRGRQWAIDALRAEAERLDASETAGDWAIGLARRQSADYLKSLLSRLATQPTDTTEQT